MTQGETYNPLYYELEIWRKNYLASEEMKRHHKSLGQTHSCPLLCCLPGESLPHHLFRWCSRMTKTYCWFPSVYPLLCRNGNGREGAGSELPATKQRQLMKNRRSFPFSLTQHQASRLALLFLSLLHLWEHLIWCFAWVTVSVKENYTSFTSFTLLLAYVGHNHRFSLDFDPWVWTISILSILSFSALDMFHMPC